MKTALITGVTGQDGSYLAELLLDKEYLVYGLVRRSSTNTTKERLSDVVNNRYFYLLEGDIVDPSSINEVFARNSIDECYNLAAMSHVATSFKQPSYTFQVDAVGVLNLLEAIRTISPATKFYQASTSELFGGNTSSRVTNTWFDGQGIPNLQWEDVQDEDTPFSPNSPYAVAKLAAHNLVRVYRSSYEIHASAGILFNHESERRGENFVTRKITKYVAKLAKDKSIDKLRLGNLDAYRDWGYAKDYVEAMWLMMQQENPDDYVIATGETHSVGEFAQLAFQQIGIDNWQDYIEIDQQFMRPCEVPFLHGYAKKAHDVLGWAPKTSFEQLVKIMVDGDINVSS